MPFLLFVKKSRSLMKLIKKGSDYTARKILYYVAGLIALTWIIIWHAACNTAGAEVMIDYVETRYPRFLKASMNAMKGDDD